MGGLPKKFRFPVQATVGYIDNFLRVVREVRTLENSVIVFDLSKTREISPLFVCFICGLLELAEEKDNKVKLVLPRNKRAAKTVRAIKPLFRTVGRPQVAIAERMIQLRKITSQNPVPIQDLVNAIGHTAEIVEDLRFNIQLTLNELLTNTMDHSGERVFYVCAGAWGKSKVVHVAALDFGVGIPNKLKTKYPQFEDDKNAIEALLNKRLPNAARLTTRAGREGGRGYPQIREIMETNKGRMLLVTGSAKAILRFDRGEYLYRKIRKTFGGTCIDLEFNTEGPNAFESLLPRNQEEIF